MSVKWAGHLAYVGCASFIRFNSLWFKDNKRAKLIRSKHQTLCLCKHFLILPPFNTTYTETESHINVRLTFTYCRTSATNNSNSNRKHFCL